jgi:hypothetical protein
MNNRATIEISQCGEGFVVTWKAEGLDSLASRGYWSENDADGKQAFTDWDDVHIFIAILAGRLGLTGEIEKEPA